ncbi:MAG: hypothetical protein V3T23_04880 [Nitrososphaerales archaeon]
MDSRWFKEDRALPKDEQLEAIEQSKLALRNSTLMHRRLEIILEEMFAKTLTNEEDFDHPDYTTRAIANASRRKTIRDIQTLLHF